MKAPAALLQKIRDAVNIVEVVGEHVVLRKAGSNHVGLCPFHSERSPSFSVSENKQLYHCYGCKKGGDLFSFVMEMHGLSFPEAIEELADRAKVALPKDWSSEGGEKREVQREKNETAFRLNRFAAAFYHRCLMQESPGMDYLKSRGVTPELIQSFYIGWSPTTWDSLAKHFIQSKAPLPVAQELGLIRTSTKQVSGGSGYFDLFRGRVLFPILNLRGKVVGFGGRLLGGDEGPKYLNSNESTLFHKSKVVFGLFQAQKHIREKNEVILVEGYFDVLALHAAGFENAVATCGTALTPDHLQLFRRLCDRVVILFDGDAAGISATERAMEIGLQQGMVLYGATLPAGLDPDELVLEEATAPGAPSGKERLGRILGSAKPILDERIAALVEEAGKGAEEKTKSVKTIAAWLSKFTDPVGREIRVQQLQKQLGVDPRLLGQAIQQTAVKSKVPAPKPMPTRPAPRMAPPKPLSENDRTLLFALGKGGDYSRILSDARGKLPPEVPFSDLFDTPIAQEFVKMATITPGYLEKLRQVPDQALDVDPQIQRLLVEAQMTEPPAVQIEKVQPALLQAIRRVWARFSQRMKIELVKAEAAKDVLLQEKLSKEYLDVQRKMKEFNGFYDKE